MVKTKTFDCVEMKRQGQQRIHEQLSGMTRQQQIEYWRKRSEKFMRQQKRLRAQPPAAPA